MGDEGVSYAYSGAAYTARPWTDDVMRIRREVEALTGEAFDCCLINLYRDGKDHVSCVIDQSVIASVSLGAARDFKIRKKDDRSDLRTCRLGHGDLLVMRDAQRDWEHSLPIRKRVAEPTINLTFRRMRA